MSKKFDQMLETAKAYGQGKSGGDPYRPSATSPGGGSKSGAASPGAGSTGGMGFDQMLQIARAYGQGKSGSATGGASPSTTAQRSGNAAKDQILQRRKQSGASAAALSDRGLPLSAAQERISGRRSATNTSGASATSPYTGEAIQRGMMTTGPVSQAMGRIYGIEPTAEAGTGSYEDRKAQEEAADERYRSALWELLGLAAQGAQDAQTGRLIPVEEQLRRARSQAEAAGELRQAKEAGDEARKVQEWDGRQELVARLNELDDASGWVVNEEQANALEAEREQVLALLRQGDVAAGNGERTYNDADAGRNLIFGTAKRIAGTVGNAALTAGKAVGEAQALSQARSNEQYMLDQMLGEDTEARARQLQEAFRSEDYQEKWDRMFAIADSWDENAAKDLQRVKEGKGVIGKAAVDIGENLIEMGFDAGVGYLTGGGSLASMFVRTFGDAAREARQAGASQEQQLLYGSAKGLIEVGTEKLFDGVAGIYGKGAADEITEGLVRRLAQSDMGRSALRWLISAASEGGEEVISDLLDPLAKAIYQGKVDYSQLDGEEVLYDFIIGAVIGGLGGMGDFANGENRAKNEALREADRESARTAWAGREAESAWDVLTGKTAPEKARTEARPEGEFSPYSTAARAAEGVGPYGEQQGRTQNEARNAEGDGTQEGHSVEDKAAPIRTENGEESRVRALTAQGQFELENGEMVSAEDERIPAELRQLGERLGELGTSAPLAFQLYENGQNTQAYAAEWELAQKVYGERTGLSFEQVKGRFHTLTETQAMEAFETGRRANSEFGIRSSEFGTGERAVEGAGPYTESGKRWAPDGKAHVSYEGGTVGGESYDAVTRKLTKAQKAQVKALEMFSQATGIRINFFQSRTDEKGRYLGENGFYDPATGSIWLDVNAGMRGVNNGRYTLICTAAHELTHHMQQAAPEQYRALQRFMLEHLNEWKGGTLDDLVRAKQAREPGLNYEDAIDEVTADGCEMMLRKTKVMQTMARENAGLFERVTNWLKEWSRRIRQAFQGIDAQHAEADAMMDWWEEQQKLWDQGIRAASANEGGEPLSALRATSPEGGSRSGQQKTAPEGGVRYSVRKGLETDLQAIRNRTFNFSGGELLIGTTSDFLVNELGFRPLPYYMPPTKAYRAMVTEEEAQKAGQPTGENINYHGLGVDGLKRILERGEEPIAAFVSDDAEDGEKRETRIVLVTDVEVNGGIGVVIVEPELQARMVGGGNTEANKNISVYDKQAILRTVQRAFDSGRLLYIDKKSGHRFDAGRKGSDCPTAIRESTRKKNIQDFWANVKWRDMKKTGAGSYTTGANGNNSAMADAFKNAKPLRRQKQAREAMPEDRELLLTAAARAGASAEVLEYRKKVRAMEAQGRRLERKRAELENAERQRKTAGDATSAFGTSPREGGPYRPSATSPRGGSEGQEKVKALREEVRKLEGSMIRYERDLGKMERRPALRKELEKARADWRNESPVKAARVMRQMQEENESLRAYVQYYQEQLKSTRRSERTVVPEDVRRVTRALLKEYGSAADPESVNRYLQLLGDEIVSARQLDYDKLQKMARRAAREIIEQSYVQEDLWNGIGDQLRSDVAGRRIQITDALRSDMTDFNYFRRTHMGTLSFVKEGGADLDQIYTDLRGSYGEALFPADAVSPSEQLDRILEAIDRTRPMEVETFHGEEKNYVTNALANDIIDRMISGDVREARTLTDQKVAKLQEALDRAEAENSFRYAELQEERSTRRELVGAKVRELRERSIEREKTYKARIRVAKAHERLSKILTENSGKKHVPDAWKETIGNFLLAVDTLSPRAGEKYVNEYAKRLLDLQRMIQKAGGLETGDASESTILDGLGEVIGERLQPMIDEAMEKDGPRSIYQMDLEKLQDLEEIMTALSEAIRKSDRLLSDERGQSLSELAGETTKHLGKLEERVYSSKAGQSLRRLLAWDNATPFYAFKRFGEAGEKMFSLLTEGWSKMAFNMKAVMDFAAETYTAEEAKAWEHEEHAFELQRRLENRLGEKAGEETAGPTESRDEAVERENRELGEEKKRVTVTTAQLMGLYLSLKRAQAQGHIYGYGIRVGDYKPAKGKPVSQTENYLVDPETAAHMVGELTERQKEVADQLQQYMEKQGSAWGNEVSMARWGIRVFTEEHYYPIKSDRSNLGKAQTKDSVQGDLFRMVNQSFTKQTVEGAKNAVMLESVFDVFSEHMANMGKYNAMALPMLDVMRWFNDTGDPESGAVSVQKAMERAYGKEAERYVLDLLQDLNGTQEGGRGEDWFGKTMGRFKVASIRYNLRVAMQQPTSIVRAGMVMDPKYLAKAIGMKGGQEKAMKWSGLAVWKDMGFFDTNVARGVREQIKHTESVVDKINEFGMKAAEFGDKVTWGAIWNACELETADRTGLKGDELMEATAKRFNEVILSTQVMDSTLTRSSLMRSKSAMVKEFTGFMSEPTLTYNMLLDVASEYSSIARSQGKEAARKAVGGKALRAVAVYTCSAAATALAAAIADAWRDDDDYETIVQKYFSHAFDNFKDNLDPTRMVPIVADAIDALKGEQKDLMSLQVLTKVSKVFQIWKETIEVEKGLTKPTATTWYGNMTTCGKIYKTLDALGTVSGLGISPAFREVVGLYNTFGGALGAPKLKTYDAGPERSLQYAVADGFLSEEQAREELLRQGLVKNETEADKLLYKWGLDGQGVYQAAKEAAIANDSTAFKTAMQALVEAGYREKDVQSAVRTAIKDQYQGTTEGVKLSKEQAERYLQLYGGMSAEDAKARVQEWTCKIVTGIAYSDLREAMVTGEIDQKKAAKYLQTYGGMSAEAAKARAAYWGFCETYPEYAEMSEESVTKYLGGLQAAGIKPGVYYGFWKDTKEMKTEYGDDGKAIEGKGRRDKVLAYIDSLPLTSAQKDLLYFAANYAESKIGETPWH